MVGEGGGHVHAGGVCCWVWRAAARHGLENCAAWVGRAAWDTVCGSGREGWAPAAGEATAYVRGR
jgi:hypothetical protein